jgi:hypothetical protein
LQCNISCRISGSYSGGYEEFYILGYNVLYSVSIQTILRRNTPPSPPLSASMNKPSKILCLLCLLPSSCWLLACLIRQPRIWATCLSLMSADFQRTTWCYIPKDKTMLYSICWSSTRKCSSCLTRYSIVGSHGSIKLARETCFLQSGFRIRLFLQSCYVKPNNCCELHLSPTFGLT